jgi:F5/8 type C domain
MKTAAYTALLLALVAPLHAQFVVKPISVAATLISTGAANTETSFDANAVNLINGNGLSAALNTNASIPATSTTITAGGDVPNHWTSIANSYNDSRLTFDLGASYSIASILLWNNSRDNGPTGALNRSILSANVSYSTNGTDYTSAGTVFFAYTIGTTQPMITQSFASSFVAQYIRVDPRQNYANDSGLGQNTGNHQRYQVNEIRFATAAAIPESSSAAALAGLLGLGFASSRRRRTTR